MSTEIQLMTAEELMMMPNVEISELQQLMKLTRAVVESVPRNTAVLK